MGEGKLLLSSLLRSQSWKLLLLLHIFYSSMPEPLSNKVGGSKKAWRASTLPTPWCSASAFSPALLGRGGGASASLLAASLTNGSFAKHGCKVKNCAAYSGAWAGFSQQDSVLRQTCLHAWVLQIPRLPSQLYLELLQEGILHPPGSRCPRAQLHLLRICSRVQGHGEADSKNS